ncbi:Fic family protein [Curtobacterium sp. SGAir0471]|uniref:Fic family protein n=1 Tax=Curtobacterium sp. SGAir0471 TaxID=2070337 RepID=UPI0020C7EF72
MKNDDDFPLMAKLVMSQYRLETLHPFSDGNRRGGRLIVTLRLLIAKEIDYPISSISAYLERRREAYIDAPRWASAASDFDPWIVMFCIAVHERSRAALQVIDVLLSYRDPAMSKADHEGIREITAEVANVVVGQPFNSITAFAEARTLRTTRPDASSRSWSASMCRRR